MDRRSFVKQVLATAAVGAVAPQVLAEPTLALKTRQVGITTMVGASRVVVGGTQYEIVLDAVGWTWKWTPVSNTMYFLVDKVSKLGGR